MTLRPYIAASLISFARSYICILDCNRPRAGIKTIMATKAATMTSLRMKPFLFNADPSCRGRNDYAALLLPRQGFHDHLHGIALRPSPFIKTQFALATTQHLEIAAEGTTLFTSKWLCKMTYSSSLTARHQSSISCKLFPIDSCCTHCISITNSRVSSSISYELRACLMFTNVMAEKQTMTMTEITNSTEKKPFLLFITTLQISYQPRSAPKTRSTTNQAIETGQRE